MKAGPTLDGRLRIDAEGGADWFVLCQIEQDAAGDPLAERLGGLMTGDAAEDWQEFVVPDLQEEFEGRVEFVRREVASAMVEAEGAVGSLWITKERAFDWYGALNQARLALEERYRFGQDLMSPASIKDVERRSAFVRSQFYSALQSLLLDHLMK
jgi:hypothetical protein